MYTHTHTHTHTHPRVLLSHKKNEIVSFAETWMDLEGIMLSEISRTEKAKYCMTSLMCEIFFKKAKFIETESRVVVVRGWGWEKQGYVGQRVQTSNYKMDKFWGI